MAKKKPKIYKLDTTRKKNPKKNDLDFFDILDNANKELDYLPPDSILLIPFLEPLLKEAGVTKKKLDYIIMNNAPNEEEKDILQWAAELGFLMMDLVDEADEDTKDLLRDEAVDVAADYVPRVKSRKILPEIELLFEELKNIGDFDSGSDELIN